VSASISIHVLCKFEYVLFVVGRKGVLYTVKWYTVMSNVTKPVLCTGISLLLPIHACVTEFCAGILEFCNYFLELLESYNAVIAVAMDLTTRKSYYKLSLLTWKALYTAEPSYLSELISPYVPARTIRSSNMYLLAIPTGVTSHFFSRFFVFPHRQPGTLYLNIFALYTDSTFKRQLKSHFFQSAFNV